MKIKTGYYGLFYKSNGKWIKKPYQDELLTKESIIYDSGLENESAPFNEHIESYLSGCRKNLALKSKLKFLRQVWE